MQDIKERIDQTQTQGYISRFEATALRPAFTQKDFLYVHTGSYIKGSPRSNYNSTPGVHNSTLSTQTSPQEVGTKPSTMQRKIQLGDHKDHKLHIVVSKDHKQFFSQKKDPKVRIRSVRNQVFGK